MEEDRKVGFGDRFEYKGKFYHYVQEIQVKIRNGKESKWVLYVEYYNNTGRYAREKKEFLKLFTHVNR